MHTQLSSNEGYDTTEISSDKEEKQNKTKVNDDGNESMNINFKKKQHKTIKGIGEKREMTK